MNATPASSARVLASLALGIAVAACQRSEPPAAQAPTVSAPADSAAGAPAPATLAAETPPPGVLRAYVWQCADGQKLVMRNLFREKAISIDFHDGARRLDQTVAASGVRYADGTTVFWTKGSSATLERAGAATVACDELRAESLREDARARGVVYRALGNEPGWTLEVGPQGALDWTTNYGQEHHAYAGTQESAGATPGSRVYTAANGDDAIKVTVTEEACKDEADVPYTHTATIEAGGQMLRGCASRLDTR